MLAAILAALDWQAKSWEADGWKYAPYLRRYLKNRRWEDRRPAPDQEPKPSGIGYAHVGGDRDWDRGSDIFARKGGEG